jgi:hypothetical protein
VTLGIRWDGNSLTNEGDLSLDAKRAHAAQVVERQVCEKMGADDCVKFFKLIDQG